MPGTQIESDGQKCNDCVPRGCACNEYHVTEFGLPTHNDGRENIEWKWTTEEKIAWTPLDEDERVWPCCEWSFDDEGLEE